MKSRPGLPRRAPAAGLTPADREGPVSIVDPSLPTGAIAQALFADLDERQRQGSADCVEKVRTRPIQAVFTQ
jgi:hypothetical protein